MLISSPELLFLVLDPYFLKETIFFGMVEPQGGYSDIFTHTC